MTWQNKTTLTLDAKSAPKYAVQIADKFLRECWSTDSEWHTEPAAIVRAEQLAKFTTDAVRVTRREWVEDSDE